MGFEQTNHYERECACGKGTEEIYTEMDDWNRTRSSTIIHCKECREKEERRKTEIKKEFSRLRILTKEITQHFNENHMEQWLHVFITCKNKKAVYVFLKENDLVDYSLNSFYQKFNGKSSEEKIASTIVPKNMETILNILNISDKYLMALSNEAIVLEGKEYNRGVAAYHRGV